jgi:hypothetical protein
MKKLLVVLLALTVLGIFAFADDAMAPAPAPIGTFTSWNTGDAILYQTVNGGSATTAWGPDWDSLYGIDDEWTFAYHGKNYGFTADLEFGMDNFGNTTITATSTLPIEGASLSRFYTYYDFVPGMLEVDLGKPRIGRAPGALAEGGSLGQFYMNSQYGAAVQLLPQSGFSAGVFTLIPADTLNAANGYGTATNYGNQLSFEAEYNMPNVFDVNAMYSTINDEFTGGITVTAIKPATFVLAWDLNTLTATKAQVWLSGGGKFIPNLETDLDLDYYSLSTGSVSSFEVEAKAEYSFNAMYAVGARIGYGDGKGAGLWGTNVGDIPNVGGVLVYPYVKANFDNGSYVTLGFSYESGAGNTNYAEFQLPISYVWSF